MAATAFGNGIYLVFDIFSVVGVGNGVAGNRRGDRSIRVDSVLVMDDSRVKDLRTGVEVGNTQGVLDGDLDQFIEASLKSGL